jgi:hypothetical protein
MIRVLERDLDRVHRENRFRLCGRRRISNVVRLDRLAVGLGWIGARHIGPRPYGVSDWGEFSKCG